jgi:hypothetical protein
MQNSSNMIIGRSSTKTHHHMASHHSKSNWSIGGDASASSTAKKVWNKKTKSWVDSKTTGVAPKISPAAPKVVI